MAPRAWEQSKSELAQLVAAKDWSVTPLEPRENWSASLNLAVDLVLSSGFPMALRWGPDFVLIYNDAYRPILGDKHPRALGLPVREAWPEVWHQLEPNHTAILSGASLGTFSEDQLYRIQRHGVEWDDAHFTIAYSPVRDDTVPNGIGGILITAVETTKRVAADKALHTLNATLEQRVAEESAKRAETEDALRQAQKMEAVGQLTGGVAHDFNNLLTVIIGGLDTVLRAKPEETVRIRRAADMALQGAQRAASLTARLLAFSRRQPLAPKPVDLNLLVRDMTDLLHRTLGEQIELEGVMAPRLWLAEIDPNQLENAILNLAVNARDAMPEGGKLTIETTNTALDESYVARDSEVIAGQYVMLSVSDNGSGMDAKLLGRVFEPFFTTKDVGKGTGLGLSMVYGFVKQSGGHVTIYSEPGLGTTIKMYFPRFLGESSADDSAEAPPPGQGEEVVLVVEDSDDVRAYSVMVLRELGYTVLEAADATSAMTVLERSARIDLLFTDVVLPGNSGRVLADAALERWPGLKVLFTTGYSRNAIVHQGRLDAGVNLLTKPFTFEQLAASVRDILDTTKRK